MFHFKFAYIYAAVEEVPSVVRILKLNEQSMRTQTIQHLTGISHREWYRSGICHGELYQNMPYLNPISLASTEFHKIP